MPAQSDSSCGHCVADHIAAPCLLTLYRSGGTMALGRASRSAPRRGCTCGSASPGPERGLRDARRRALCRDKLATSGNRYHTQRLSLAPWRRCHPPRHPPHRNNAVHARAARRAAGGRRRCSAKPGQARRFHSRPPRIRAFSREGTQGVVGSIRCPPVTPVHQKVQTGMLEL